MENKNSKAKQDLAIPLNDMNVSAINASTNDNNKNSNTTQSNYVPITISNADETNVITSFKQISFFKKMFFLWTLITMKISNKASLKISHLLSYIHLKETRSDLFFLREIWFGDETKGKKGYNTYKFCPLLLAIIRANAISLFLLFCVTFINTGMKFVQIFFLRQLILVFKHLTDPSTKEPMFSLIPSVIFFLSAKVVYIVVNYQIKYLEEMIGKKTSNQISSLIYEKTMGTSASARSKFSEGQIMNYIQNDSDSLGMFFYYFPKTIVFPFQFSMYMFMLFKFFGYSFIFGFIIFLILMTVSFIVQKLYIQNQFLYLKDKDARMKITSQTFHMLKVLKLYAWEDEFESQINEKREIELKSMKKILNLGVISQFIHWSIPLILSIVSVGVYTYTSGVVLDIANLMTSIDIFDSMSGPLYRLPLFITSMLNAFISMNRISTFLKIKDAEKQYTTDITTYPNKSIKIENCSFGNNVSNKILMSEVNLDIEKGELVAILGETGSGKTCLINSIMGLMDKMDNNPFIINGSFALASQTPWIMNETIRNNIVFYKNYDEDKYKKILSLCQLEKDIENLPGGDLTEIGANGANISGGQKARISLARCIYADADIYLFDDPISSVDSYVSMEIFTKMFYEYLKGKTRIVVTNDVRSLNLCDKIIFIEKGKIIFSGKYDEIKNKEFYKDLVQAKLSSANSISNNDNIITNHSDISTKIEEEKSNDINKESSCDNFTHHDLISLNESPSMFKEVNTYQISKKGKLTKDEDQGKGRMGLKIYHKFIQYTGGYLFVLVIVFASVAWQLAKVLSNVWLAKWTNATTSENLYYFLIYTQIGFLSIFFLFIKDFLISRATLIINRKLHNLMLHPLIKAPINLFHDTIPIGQILNRLTHDLENAKLVIKIGGNFLKGTCTLIGAIVVCCQYNKYCLILSPLLIFLGILIANYYVNAGRDLNRLTGISRSPILSLYSETITGMNTIKAFNVEDNFSELFFNRLDDYYTVVNYKIGASSWFSMFLELLSELYVFFILIYAVIFKSSFTASAIGLLIKYSVSFSEEMCGVIDYIIEIERTLVSIERCESYSKIIQEKADVIRSMDHSLSKSGWPTRGEIVFDDVSLRYRPEIDLTLKNISIRINPKEKIGIVGRTGSGKSTLSLALFRLVEIEKGKITIDDIDTAKIGLKCLRSSLTIVPQDPTLFEGNLRFNLDPLHQYKDSEIINSINQVGLFNLMQENGRDISKGIEIKVKENGANLSLGEKQMICFARAILRKSKIILLDEATASVDQKTERAIQDVLEKIFIDTTMITIAHRIQTVKKCDKILVMDNGRIVEFDSPQNLLKKDTGIFKMLYQKNSSD